MVLMHLEHPAQVMRETELLGSTGHSFKTGAHSSSNT